MLSCSKKRTVRRPPLDGSVNVEEAIEFHWEYNPDAPFYVFSPESDVDDDDDDGGRQRITEISHLEFGRACHRVARYIGSRFGGPTAAGSISGSGSRQVIALVALADVMVYQAICIGIIKAGYIPFPISTRNSPAAVLHLLKQTGCHRLLTTRVTLQELLEGVWVELQKEEDPSDQLQVEEIPALAEVYPNLGRECENDYFMPYSLPSAHKRAALTDTAIYLHSSGSTGFPKPIPQTNGILIHWASFPAGRQYADHDPPIRIAGMHFPPFHTAGFMTQLVFPLYNGCSIALYPPVVDRPEKAPVMPTPENIIWNAKRTQVNVLPTVPTQIQAWSRDLRAIEFLASLIHVVISAGAMAPKVAQSLLASGVRMVTSYGGTEFGSPTLAFGRKVDERDWDYVEFDHRCKVRWKPQGDGTFECQFLKTETHSLPVENLPDVRGYATSDLFVPHPTKSHLWKIVGRIDDVIIHASGEKTVPAPIEDIVMSSPYVMGTLMFGRAHSQAGILIEPKAPHIIDVRDTEQVAQFRELIWPVIEEANQVAPAFSGIFKDMILITDPNKALPRTAKGTVMRKLAVKLYEPEIEGLYSTVEASLAATTELVKPPRAWDKVSVVEWLVEQAREINGKAVEPSDDLFEYGFDSLKATILRRRITGALQSLASSSARSQRPAVDPDVVYKYPSIDALSVFLISAVSDGSISDSDEHSRSRVAAIEEMIEKYAHARPIDRPASKLMASKLVVLLTGSTGNLGSEVLEGLLRNSRVVRVYALNRPSVSAKSVSERHVSRFRDKGLDISLLESGKLVYVEGDLSLTNLGLSDGTYTEIRHSINVIIHNAWRLDFNLSLSSFESNVKGTRNLIDLARSSPRVSDLKFIFTSSIASAASWDPSLGAYPEEIVMDPKYAVGNGYGESKYVAERILATSGLNATSLRIGQVSGCRHNGAWATTDWLPILVKSSLSLGFLPLTEGVVSWIPMDRVASSILDLVSSERPFPPAMNILHTKPKHWNFLMECIAEALEEMSHKSPSLISFGEWVRLLEKVPDEKHADVPATKLLDFFKHLSRSGDNVSRIVPSTGDQGTEIEAGGLTTFTLKNIKSHCPSLDDMVPLNRTDVHRWVSYWEQAGLFH